MSEQTKRRLYVAMKLMSSISVEPAGPCAFPFPVQIILPDGCAGILYVFDTPEAVREWSGADAQLTEIEVNK